MSPYEKVGRQVVGDVIGEMIAADPGFDWSTLVNAAAEAANQGIKYDQNQKQTAQSKAQSLAAAQKAIAADAAWASAEQQVDLAQQSHDANRIGPATALQGQMMSQALAAGAGLTPDAAQARAAAAQKASAEAATAAMASPSDQAKQALSRAWQKVASLAVASGGAGAGSSSIMRSGMGGGSWITRVHGGVPTYVWIGGGAAAATGIVLLLRALFRKKRK